MYTRITNIILLILLVLMAAGCGMSSSTSAPSPAAPVPTTINAKMSAIPSLLRMTWRGYKADFIQGDGRVVDPQRNRVTTSEGQSYALLRAVWMDDRPTFDLVWDWTRHNLQVRPDKLFGYLWGKRRDGRWTNLDKSSATDADEDIALALIFAAHRWHAPAYQRQARDIVGDVWRQEVADVRGTPYLTAGNWGPSYDKPGPAINPSYFAPYAYRVFAHLDRSHPWMRVVDSSYRVLADCSSSPLGGRSSVDLPPNWCALDRATGAVTSAPALDRANLYGYDAFRAMWRVALDYRWNKEPRAKEYLTRSIFLRERWRQDGLLTAYSHSGAAEGPEILLFYGGDIGNFVVSAPAMVRAIMERKLLPAFRRQGNTAYWDQRYVYYEQNWIWFGVALAHGQLPNLAIT